MSAVLKALAKAYRVSQAGSTGVVTNDFGRDYHDLLQAAQAVDGEARVLAEQELRQAAVHSDGLLKLETHPRDASIIHRVSLSRAGGEAWLFALLGEPNPTEQRLALSNLIASFVREPVPASGSERWQTWCEAMSARALQGASISPLKRDDEAATTELLRVLARMLSWQGESLIRFASTTICGNSKRLEELRPALTACLRQITADDVTELKDLGLLDKPRQVLLHGPLRLTLLAGALNVGWLQGPITLSETDLEAAVDVHCDASHCLTVENETTFWELAKLRSGVLLIHTSYPGRAVRHLFSLLPADLPCFHFGDTDPAGFDILRDLQVKTDRKFIPLHMHFRDDADSAPLSDKEKSIIRRLLADPKLANCHEALNQMLAAGRKGSFEQESLGLPAPAWPFY